jgi:predicted PurR-regulated permease PerM
MNMPGRYVLPIALVSAILYFLFAIRQVLLPFVLAATLAYLLNPVIEFFVVRGVRRSPIVIGLYAVLMTSFVLIVYLGGTVLNREATKAALKMPQYIQTGQAFLNRVRSLEHSPYAGLLRGHENLIEEFLDKARSWPTMILSHMPSFASHLLPAFELAFLVPFIAFFLMREGPLLIDAFFQWMPARYVEMFLNVVVEIDNSLGRYLRAVSLQAISAGICALIGFWLIGLDYALQIAIIMAVGGLVPYLGPVSGTLIGSAVALFEWGTPVGIFKVICVCVSVRLIEDWFLQPMILKKAVHLHPVLVIFSLMAGTAMWGFWGLLFGVPVACMVRVTLPVLVSWYRSEYGLSSGRPPAEILHIPLI